MPRRSRSRFIPQPSHAVSQQHFHAFRQQYPQACSRQQLDCGILPVYPEDIEAYRLCREWEETYEQYDRPREVPAFNTVEDDDSDLAPVDTLSCVSLPTAIRKHGRWRQTPACHRYDPTPPDRQLQRSYHEACEALIERLSPRDRAILDLYAAGRGPREIRQRLALTLTEQRVGQIIGQIRSKAIHLRHAQHSQHRTHHHDKPA